MKKTLSLLVITISLLNSQAYAKTQGNYFGIDISRNTAKVKSTSSVASDNSFGNTLFYNHNKKNSAYGFGLNYKYAFNFNNFFVAPGISYEFLNNQIKSSYGNSSNDFFSQNVKLKSAISLRANIGYDINDQFALYAPIGISQFSYDIRTLDVSGSDKISSKKSNHESVAFIGLGFSYEPFKNWLVNLEYNKYQNLKLTSGKATFNNGQIHAKTNVDLMKIGLAYRF
jgi:opacity protein-like surface antigen